ncbi:hypothetical protein AOL_s00006g457 [Orbilia oligospora ATCC 24927]|uniref:Uncharacterized protein n=1 Tax=Arthrobotrys oligospora (strain ATCC 24927 / CBS 115.81 / DSM 1491) TaxID=756982 RepID=G1X0Q6_ARTOA|nr:hypothetical protein AOL_s00006g457 [Orbilia oligospora ATCC 24927]EGX53591.1 hypothetical protein AOL_s00006g457 [Orbilia oligospora ATCC 24927]
MRFHLLPPLFSISILILTSKVSCWYLLTLRSDRRWTANNKPVSTSWLREINSLTECVPNQNNRNKPVVIDAVALYNRPGTTIARGVAIYANSYCGIKNPNSRESVKIGTHVPDILLLPDQNKLEGIHLFDLKGIGVETNGKFYRAIDPVEEVRFFDGLLWESESKPGVYWWDGAGTWKRIRHLGDERRVKYVDGGIADHLISTSALYDYVRLLLEFFINPERMGDEEEALKGYKRIAEKQAIDGPPSAVNRRVPAIANPAVVSEYFQPESTSAPSTSAEGNLQGNDNDQAGQKPPAENTRAQQPQRAGYLPLVLPTMPLPFTYLPWGYEQLQSGLESILNIEVLKGIQEILGIERLANPAPFRGLEGDSATQPAQATDEIRENTGQESAPKVASRRNEDAVPGVHISLDLVSESGKRKDEEVIVIDEDEEDIPALEKKRKTD